MYVGNAVCMYVCSFIYDMAPTCIDERRRSDHDYEVTALCISANTPTFMHTYIRPTPVIQCLDRSMRRHSTIADIAYCLNHTRRCAYTSKHIYHVYTLF